MNPQWQYNALLVPHALSLVLILVLIIIVMRQRHHHAMLSTQVFLACLLLWMSMNALELATLNTALSLFFADFSFLGITFMPIAWLGIVMEYLGKEWQLKRWLPALVAIPLVTNIVIWTNQAHGLWRGDSYRDLALTWFPVWFYDYGSWFYFVHLPFSLGIVFTSLFLLVRATYIRQPTFRTQIVLLAGALTLPLFMEVLHRFGISPIPYYNASSLAFPVSAVMIVVALLRYRLFDLKPIAREYLIENLLDFLVVLDDKNRILDINPSAHQRLFDGARNIIGKPVQDVLGKQHPLLACIENYTYLTTEVSLYHFGEWRYYAVRISPIQQTTIKHPAGKHPAGKHPAGKNPAGKNPAGKHPAGKHPAGKHPAGKHPAGKHPTGKHPAGDLIARIIMMQDISISKRTEETMMQQAQQVAILEERQRLARELHDSVNQTLFAAGTLADLLPRAIEKKPERVPEYATSIRSLLNGASAQMRLILLELYPDALAKTDLGVTLKHLADAHTGNTNIPVDVYIGAPIFLPEDAQLAFYRIAQEALHNIHKHAQASHVVISLKQQGHYYTLTIEDDGVGFDASQTTESDHFGLANMRERARYIGADYEIKGIVDEGTAIIVTYRLPQKAK